MYSLKKCTRCTRNEQPITEFINSKGRECNTCSKCRESERQRPISDEKREAKNRLQREKKYYQTWRDKKRAENEEEFKDHKNDVQKEWRLKNPGHIAQWCRTSVNTRLDAIKRSAIKRQIEWDLDDDLAKGMLTKPCVYCGHIDLTVRVNGIDRMDSFGPYSEKNCVPCCKTCNYMKCTLDPLSFIEVCKKIAQCSYEFPPDIKRSTENRFAPKSVASQNTSNGTAEV